jgi:hypothetical protein
MSFLVQEKCVRYGLHCSSLYKIFNLYLQIPVSVKARRPTTLIITQVTYDFLSLLPSTESLASRGPRLQETAVQRQGATYAPPTQIKVEVEEASHKLIANFVDDKRLVLAQGEYKSMRVWLSNAGTVAISELWMVSGPEDQVWASITRDPKPESASKLLRLFTLFRT